MKEKIPHEELQQSIESVMNAEVRVWNQIGYLLDQVEVTGYWRGNASSFTEWLRLFASALGLGESSLWRYLASARYFEELRKALDDRGVSCPQLHNLPVGVSPESLEILSKLARVAPDDLLQGIAKRVVSGTIKRAELRRTWEAYRPALAGKTARGTGVEAPTIDLRDADQFDSVIEARVLTSLSAADPAWIGIERPASFEIFHRVRPEFDMATRERFEFDAVVVVRSSKNDPLEFHGIEILGSYALNPNLGVLLEKERLYCNYMWLVLDERSQQVSDYELSADIGILEAKGNTIWVLRRAQYHRGERTGELAKGLLLRTLRF